jgi:cytochrome c oxidase subunit II
MGFNVPDLGLRADIIPGQTTRLRIVPGKVGQCPFFCDIFFGTGHEAMIGIIRVME